MVSTHALVVAAVLTAAPVPVACGNNAPPPSYSPAPAHSSLVGLHYGSSSGVACTGWLPGAGRVIVGRQVPLPVFPHACGASHLVGSFEFE